MDVGSRFLSLSPVIWVPPDAGTLYRKSNGSVSLSWSPQDPQPSRCQGQAGSRDEKASTRDCSGGRRHEAWAVLHQPRWILECWVWLLLAVAPEETVPGPFGADSIKFTMPALLKPSTAVLYAGSASMFLGIWNVV